MVRIGACGPSSSPVPSAMPRTPSTITFGALVISRRAIARDRVFAPGIPPLRRALAPKPMATRPPAGATIVAAHTARPIRKLSRLGSQSPKTSWKVATKPSAEMSSNPTARTSHVGRPLSTHLPMFAAPDTLTTTAPATSASNAITTTPRRASRPSLADSGRTGSGLAGTVSRRRRTRGMPDLSRRRRGRHAGPSRGAVSHLAAQAPSSRPLPRAKAP